MASRLQLSCWQLTQVLRLACRSSNFLRDDCVQGPHKWYALPGQALKPRDPKAVDVFDERGEQSGCNNWAGLRRVEEELNDRYWRDSPWVDHACDQCRKYTPREGQDFWTQAAAIDGNTSTRYFKVCKRFFSGENALLSARFLLVSQNSLILRRRYPYLPLVAVWVRPLQTLPRTLHSGG